jgi:hypothetical protein
LALQPERATETQTAASALRRMKDFPWGGDGRTFESLHTSPET